jgi:hypothetical protein
MRWLRKLRARFADRVAREDLADAIQEVEVLEDENKALRDALRNNHVQMSEVVETLHQIIGAVVLQQEKGQPLVLSGDLLASAACMPAVELEQAQDGTMTVFFPGHTEKDEKEYPAVCC